MTVASRSIVWLQGLIKKNVFFSGSFFFNDYYIEVLPVVLLWFKSSRFSMFSQFAVKLHNPQGNATYSVRPEMVIWPKYVYPKQPLQMWYCKIPVAALNLTRVRRFKVTMFVCVCVCVEQNEKGLQSIARSWINCPRWFENSAPSWRQQDSWRDLWTSARAWSNAGFSD